MSVSFGLLVLAFWVMVKSIPALSTATNVVDLQEEIKRMVINSREIQSGAEYSMVYYVVDQSDGFSDHIRLAIWDELDVFNWNLRSLGDIDVKAFLHSPDEATKLNYAAQSILPFRELQEPQVSVSTLNTWLELGKIDGYFILPENIRQAPEDVIFVTRLSDLFTRDQQLMEMKAWYEEKTKFALQSVELEAAGIVDQSRDHILQSIEVDIEKILPKSISNPPSMASSTHTQSTLNPFVVFERIASIGYLVLFCVVQLFASQLFLTNVIEEKSNRLSEFLSSTVDPILLLDGKLLGQILVIGIGLVVVCAVVLPLLFAFLTSLPPAKVNSVLAIVHPVRVLHWILFLVCALSFYGYIISALGSLCHDPKEVGMTIYPVHFVVIFGAIPVSVITLFNLESTLTAILTFIPPFTPFVMIARSAALPAWPMYLIIVLLMLASIFILRAVSGRIFSKGLLLDYSVSDFRTMMGLARKPVA